MPDALLVTQPAVRTRPQVFLLREGNCRLYTTHTQQTQVIHNTHGHRHTPYTRLSWG